MKRVLFWLIVAGIGYLQYRFWFTDDGFIGTMRLKGAIRAKKEENSDILNQSNSLRKDIASLQKGGHAIENRARDELGMTKKGEVFYHITK